MGVSAAGIGFVGIHHVGVLCENLERSLEFYCGLLGMFFAITITCIQSDLVRDKHPYHMDMNERENRVSRGGLTVHFFTSTHSMHSSKSCFYLSGRNLHNIVGPHI